MKKSKVLLSALALAIPASATAQDAVQGVPVQAVRVAAKPATVLPANTEILLKMNQEVTTKGRTWDEGDTFNLSTVHDVLLGDYVVIPAGTRGVGRITWLTSKGAFGKSGKMDVELEYLELGGRRINIDGTYRQEGEGNTVATVGGVVLAGVFAGFITGKSGRIPQGRELMATLESDLAVALPEGATVRSHNAPVQAVAAAGTPAAEQQAVIEEAEREEAIKSSRPPAEIKIGSE